MTYTPDFVGNNFIIEAKGRPNDVFPYKWKLFQYNLVKSGLDEQYNLFIVHNHKEVDECIKQIKQLTDGNKNVLEEYDLIVDLGLVKDEEESENVEE